MQRHFKRCMPVFLCFVCSNSGVLSFFRNIHFDIGYYLWFSLKNSSNLWLSLKTQWHKLRLKYTICLVQIQFANQWPQFDALLYIFLFMIWLVVCNFIFIESNLKLNFMSYNILAFELDSIENRVRQNQATIKIHPSGK